MKLDLRVLQIDLARQKENIPYVKKYIDVAKKWGYNYVLFYLENAVRTEDTSFFNKDETYSISEMREMIDYAHSVGIEIIPAFENLGHLEKFFDYEQFHEISEITDITKEGRAFYSNPRGADGCVSNPRLYELMDKYISDVASLFSSPYIHMGLDEPWDFGICKKCQERIKNGETKNDLFKKHVLHTYELAKKLGKRMMMWDDFFEYADVSKDLPRDIIMCNWNYSFIGQEPNGHWTNRRKRDWFKYYDELGFDYMFCVYSNRISATYNLETFTKYAEKYSPIGAIMTAWCRNDSFYEGAMPFVAYGGKLWNGEVKNREDVIDIYTELLSSRKFANIVYDNVSNGGGYTSTTTMCENDSILKYIERKRQHSVVTLMEEELKNIEPGEARDIADDIYARTLTSYNNLKLSYFTEVVFDSYQNKKDVSYLLDELKEIRQKYDLIISIDKRLWQKNRPDIKSCKDSFNKRLERIGKWLDRIENDVKTVDQNVGVLTVEFMLPEFWLTAKGRIIVKYKGDSEETLLHKGGIKPTVSGYDVGGCHAFRFKIQNRELEYIKFAIYGEGAYFPTHFKYFVNDKLYYASEVEVVSGICEHPENVLINDTRFCKLGNEDGLAHFNDIELSKEFHEIKVKFKRVEA